MFRSSALSLESDSDSTFTDLTLTPGSPRSPGTTSTSSFSIPWAEEAIQKNKDEWERVERMLYGEEPLPTEEPLRSELSLWMRAFPHLRVNGRSCKLHYSGAPLKPTNPLFEEVFAIDPGETAQVSQEQPKKVPIKTLNFEGLSLASRPPVFEKVKTIEIDPSGRITHRSVEYRKLSTLPEVGFVIRKNGATLGVSKILTKTPSASRSATLRPNLALPPIPSNSALDGVVGRSISANLHSRKHAKRKSFLPALSPEET